MTLKAIPTPAPYISASTMRTMMGRTRWDDSQDQSLVRRATGYVFRCAEINSDRVAATPLHLYRPVRASRKMISTRDALAIASRSEHPVWAVADLLPGRRISKARRARMEADNSNEVRRKVAAMSGDWEEVPAHPIMDLLANPNVDESGYDLTWVCQMYQELCGRVGWLKVGKGGMPMQLRTLMPQYLKPVYSDPGGERFFKGFEYGTDISSTLKLTTDDVCYFKKPDVTDLAGGMGPLEVGLHVSDAEQAIHQARWQMFQMGSMIQYAVVTQGTLGEETRKSIITSWQQRFSGVRNWFKKPIVLDQGTDLKRISDPPKDMALSDALRDVIRDVCIQFGVPVSMLTTEGGNKLGETSNAEQGSSDYVQNTLIPRLRRNEAVLNAQLLPDFGDGYLLAYVLPHSEDEKGKAEVSALWTSNGIKTINEVREELELAPIEGGDVPRFGGTALTKLDAPAPEPFGFGGGPRADGVGTPPAPDDAAEPEDDMPEPEPEDDAQPVEKSRSVVEVKPKLSKPKAYRQSHEAVYGCGHKAEPEPGEPFNPAAFPDIAELAGGVTSVIDRMRAQILGGLTGTKANGPTSAELDRIFQQSGYSYDEWVSVMTAELERGLRTFIEQGAQVGRMALASDVVGVSFDLANPKVAEFLDRYRLQFREAAASTVASVEADTRRALQEGLIAGDSIGGLEKRLNEAYDGFTPYRAELIARTESARAYSAGHEAAWVESPNVVGKRWNLAPRACAACEAVAAQFNQAKIGQPFVRKGTTLQLPGGDTFAVDFGDVDGPPLHPNDRCTISPILSGDTA